MEEFKKGSSRPPQDEETLLEQIRRRITPELTYKKKSVTLEGAKMESKTILKLEKGDYQINNEKWNYLFSGWGQLVVPQGENSITNPKDFEGYAFIKDGKCEKICNVINIKN